MAQFPPTCPGAGDVLLQPPVGFCLDNVPLPVDASPIVNWASWAPDVNGNVEA